MAKLAVETENAGQRFFPACAPIGVAIALANNTPKRNVTSADQIEALIDGVGAAMVGERRFFDPPKGRYSRERYGFDDSCIFSLLVGRFDMEDAGVDAIVDVFGQLSSV